MGSDWCLCPVCHDTQAMEVDDYWGGCPQCGRNDGCHSVGPDHWYICRDHRVKWWVGSNLFSTWKHLTPAEQRRNRDELSGFTVVEPLPCTKLDEDGLPNSDVPF
jgi:hypothetical protein